ncbi:hypothetical protein J8I26_13910 [Herbaspirillum sp. LeCh32-8]|uniref:hypothetical protein n=1 Tax=Herbaspirillum sp. LeCh32-8 TaxID=2821356 RepID=UPI001AE4B56D|nr:hypothetical protein [Herbaspirillum sp. LeCh32-8]MBP0599211.1 hypothetical protein [Herbaspirillum sp. LeCh32-8]
MKAPGGPGTNEILGRRGSAETHDYKTSAAAGRGVARVAKIDELQRNLPQVPPCGHFACLKTGNFNFGYAPASTLRRVKRHEQFPSNNDTESTRTTA